MKTGLRYKVVLITLLVTSAVFILIPVSFGDLKRSASLQIETKEGKTLGKARNENGAYQEWVKLKDFPKFIPEVVVLAEDKRFYSHFGFDPFAIGNTIWQFLTGVSRLRGASTITQQVVRLTKPTLKKFPSFVRKPIEIVYAMKYEFWLTKDQLLEFYLNSISIHSNHVGFPSATKRFFAKDMRFISREESIALTVLIRENQPSFETFSKRVAYLNSRIEPISDIQLSYLKEKLEFGSTKHRISEDLEKENLHFERWLRTQTKDLHGNLITGFSNDINSHLYSIVVSELESLRKYNASNASVVVLEINEAKSHSAKLVGMIGSKNFFEEGEGQVNGTLAYRDAGSTLKPLLYGYALEKKILTPNSILHDENRSFRIGKTEGLYNPRNADLQYWGNMTAVEALANSRNVPAVEVLEKIKIDPFYRFLKDIGWSHMTEAPDHYGLGLALGTGGGSLVQLARSYASFPLGGYLPRLEIGVIDGKGFYLGEERRIYSQETTEEISSILSDTNIRKRAFGGRNFLEFPYPVAVKTGTSKDYRNSWTVGYTNKYIVAVWVGNFSGERTLEVSGSFGAGRIFHSTIRYLNEKEKNITSAYPSLIQRTVCRKSGLLAGKTCPQVTIRIRKQNSLTKECNEHNLTTNERPRLIAPIDGQVFMVQPHLALDHQFVPIKVKNRNKDELVQIRLGKASYFNLDANGMTRIPFTLGKHELTLLSGTSEFQKIQISIK